MMVMPDDVYATLSAVVSKYPHIGTDDERREAMKKVVQTIRFRHGERYVWKTEHQSLIAPSKDGLGYVPTGDVVHGQFTQMFIWDTISGSTRKPNNPPLNSEELRSAYVLVPEAKDWLKDVVEPPDKPPEQPPNGELLRRLADVEKRTWDIERQVREMQDKVDLAKARADEAFKKTDEIVARINKLKLVPAPELPDIDAIPTNSTWGHGHRIKTRIEG
jgi:hypothetical protein